MDSERIKQIEAQLLNDDLDGTLDIVRELLAALSETDKTAKPSVPVCPHCKANMYVAKYKGYYESFPYWSCICHDDFLEILKSSTWKGRKA